MENTLYKTQEPNNEVKMDLKQYQIHAARTFLSKGDTEKDIMHCLIGMQTDLGELSDPFKKGIFYGKDIDLVNVGEELGDLLWYVANLCRITGIDLEQQLIKNINKLKVRFPEKFTEQNAIVRNLEAERIELEK